MRSLSGFPKGRGVEVEMLWVGLRCLGLSPGHKDQRQLFFKGWQSYVWIHLMSCAGGRVAWTLGREIDSLSRAH